MDVEEKLLNILLVEDDALVRAGFARVLRAHGFAVVEAATAEAALPVFSEDPPPDLLLTDVLLPGMTGVDLVRTLGDRELRIPVILVSGHDDGDHATSVPFRFLPKPVDTYELLAAIEEALGRPAYRGGRTEEKR